jgi:hypothetical protein
MRRRLLGLSFALGLHFACGFEVSAQIPAPYSPTAPAYAVRPTQRAPRTYSRGYAFKDESILSVNNSYLGYGNLVDPGLPSSAPRYDRAYIVRPNLGSFAAYPAPRPGLRWYWRRHGYGY